MSKDLRDNYDLGILAGVAQERERIIKLLEAEFAEGNEHICESCDIYQAILKGETGE